MRFINVRPGAPFPLPLPLPLPLPDAEEESVLEVAPEAEVDGEGCDVGGFMADAYAPRACAPA